MKLCEMLQENCMTLGLGSNAREGVLKEIVNTVDLDGMVADRGALVDALCERERLGSTGIGYGIAIPHARTDAVRNIVMLFGRSAQGVEFGAMDGKPVHLFFMIASPPAASGEYLKVLARLASLLKEEDFRKKLMGAENCKDILSILRNGEGGD